MKRWLGVLTVLLLGLAWTPAVSAFGDEVITHGLISQGYIDTSDNNFLGATSKGGTRDFREVILNFQQAITPRWRIGAQFMARDLMEDGNMSPHLDWGYGDFKLDDRNGLRIGRVKIGAGLSNRMRDIDIVRPGVFYPLTVYLEDARHMVTALNGGMLYGTIPLNRTLGKLKWEYGFGGGQNDANSGYTKEFIYTLSGRVAQKLGESIKAVATGAAAKASAAAAAAGKTAAEQAAAGAAAASAVATSQGAALKANFPNIGGDREVNIKFMQIVHLEWYPSIEGLKLVFSRGKSNMEYSAKLITGLTIAPLPGMVAIESNIDFTAYDLYALQYQRQGWTFSGEMLRPYTKVYVNGAMSHRDYEGNYLQLAYRFNPHWEAAVTHANFYKDRNDRDGEAYVKAGLPGYYGRQRDNTLSIRYDVSEDWSLKAELHEMNGTGLVHAFENPNGMKENWRMVVLKTTYNF